MPIPSPRLSPVLFDRPAINWGSHNSLFGFNNFLEWLTELREIHFVVYYKDIIKDMNKQQDEEISGVEP